MSSLATKAAQPDEQEEARDGSQEEIMKDHDQHRLRREPHSMPPNFRVTNIIGDLTIDPPDNAIVIHSVNCLGQWGSGVALALVTALPAAYKVYQECCKKHSPEGLLGTALLIPPQKDDYDLKYKPMKPRRWVYCLFVSEGYGRATKRKPGKAKPEEIIRHTRNALKEVREVLFLGQQKKVDSWGSAVDEYGQEQEPKLELIWACKFNSGSFGVKWETTMEIIKDIFEGRNGDMWEGEMKVVSRV